MGFNENGVIFKKNFPAFGCALEVDFNRAKLIYPETIKGRDRNDSFDAPENFVVFECVNRLLEKGYRPDDIELEKEWHLGHDAKSGRADICVSYNGEMLFIIFFSANVFEPFGYINKLLIDVFFRDSVLWGIDGDWMVNFYEKGQPFYPTDHCGVLRALTDEVNPRYMTHILETEGIKMNFSRSYRASIDRVEGIAFTVPDIEIQNEAMSEV